MRNVFFGFLIGLILLVVFSSSDLSFIGKVVDGENVTCYTDDDCKEEISNPCLKIKCIKPGTNASYCDGVHIDDCIDDDGCCPDNCKYTDDNDCEPICGDNVIDEGEVCDGYNLSGETCESFGYDGGNLSCEDNCTNFNFDDCFYYETTVVSSNGGGGSSGAENDLDEEDNANTIGGSELGQVMSIGQGQDCSDGTPSGSCSNDKPYYCDDGVLIEKCGVCGCNSGETCFINQCLTSGELEEFGIKCNELDEENCTKDSDCIPVYKNIFLNILKGYENCVLRECGSLSKKECKEAGGCKLVYDEFCIGEWWCFFKYYKYCEQI